MPTLSIQLPGLPPVSHVLKDETITIGRMKGNTIVIDDSSISLMHAKITRKSGDFLLKDLNSTNGTIVNGQSIGEAVLRDGDRVRFAEILCQFLANATEKVASSGIAAPVPAPPLVSQPALVPESPATRPVAAAVAEPSPLKRSRQPSFALLRYAGVVLAMGVVSLVGWRIFQLNHETSDKSDRAGSATLPAAARALTEGRVQPATYSVDKVGKETASRIANGPNSSDSESEELAKRPTQSGDEKISTKEGVSQLVEALKSQDVAERQKAAAALHSLGAGAKEAIPALREALTDKDPDVQMWSALAMVNNQELDKRTVPVLVRTLQNDNPVLRQVACLSLGLIPYLESEKDSVIPALTETANKDANDEVRKAALSALSIVAPDAVRKTALK